MAPLIFKVSVLNPVEEYQVSVEQRVGWAAESVWALWKRDNLFCPWRESNTTLVTPARSAVITATAHCCTRSFCTLRTHAPLDGGTTHITPAGSLIVNYFSLRCNHLQADDTTTPGRRCGIKLLIKENVCLRVALVVIMHGWGVPATLPAYTTPYLPHVLTLIEGLLPRKDGVQRAGARTHTHSLSLSHFQHPMTLKA
jgi:hypothetical protein